MGVTRETQSATAGKHTQGPTATTDRWLRAAGVLLAWAAVACALAGAFRHAPGTTRGAVALAATLCACAVLVAWAFMPTTSPSVAGGHDRSRPYAPEPRGWRAAPGVRSTDANAGVRPSSLPFTADAAPPTVTIARPAGDRQPLAPPPRPLYALDELTAAEPSHLERSPYLDDPLFRLEDPGPGGWLVRVNKDPTQLCQDSFACDPARRVYAVTDGVSRSFMPAAWARIVAQAAVAHPDPFGGEAEFAAWLDDAADRWRAWMRSVWLPQARASIEGHHHRDGSLDWSDAIDGQGAQTTLVCCSLSGRPQRGGEKTVRMDVTAIGDAECLLFRQAAGRWELVTAFPLEHPSDFGATPATLATRRDPARVAAMYRSLRRGSFEARPGDRLALATDAVACWLLECVRARVPDDTAAPLSGTLSPASGVVARPASPAASGDPIALALDNPATFERLAQAEIDAGRLDDDDLTLLVVAIS